MMRKTLVLFSIIFLALGAGVVSAAPVLTFGIDINDDQVFENDFAIPTIGGSQAIDLYAIVTDDASGVGTLLNPIQLQGFGINLMYDAALMDVTAASVAAQWTFGGSVNFATDGSVLMSGTYFNFVPPPYGIDVPALLGSITFLCEGPGTSLLTVYPYSTGTALASPNTGVTLDAQLVGGLDIGSVNQVPIPGTILLLGSGLVGLVGRRIRSRRRQE